MYLCIPAKCFPPPYRKQTLTGSAMTWSHSQECFSSIKKKTSKKQSPQNKTGKTPTFFSLLALVRRKHKICPCIPLNEARLGFLDLLTVECTNMHVPLPSLSWRSFCLELSKAFFLLMGNSSARMLNPNFLWTACQWWLAPAGLWQGIFSRGEMKWSRSCPNSKHKRSHSSLVPTLPSSYCSLCWEPIAISVCGSVQNPAKSLFGNRNSASSFKNWKYGIGVQTSFWTAHIRWPLGQTA